MYTARNNTLPVYVIVCMQHFPAQHNVNFTVCNIQCSECRRFTLSSWIKYILTAWEGLCGYDRDISCQDFCTVYMLGTFPSHFSICKQHVISAVQHLHVVLSCFLIFHDGVTNWEYCCESAIIFCGPNPFQLSPIFHYLWPIHTQKGNENHQTLCFVWKNSLSYSGSKISQSTWAVAHQRTIYGLRWLWSKDLKLLENATLFLFLMHPHSYISDAEPGKA